MPKTEKKQLAKKSKRGTAKIAQKNKKKEKKRAKAERKFACIDPECNGCQFHSGDGVCAKGYVRGDINCASLPQ